MGKSVIIVGNGRSLKESGLGKKIDEFDEVIRINDWKTEGFEEDAGLKTTVWVLYNPSKKAYRFIDKYEKMGYDIKQMKETVKSLKEIWYICWKPDNLINAWKDDKFIDKLGINHVVKRHQSVTASKRNRRIVEYPTTGFNAILTLLTMYDKVYLAGFDFAGAMNKSLTKHHYYDEKTINIDIHDPEAEYEHALKLIDEGRLEFLTKDTEIQKAKYIGGDIRTMTCSSCGKDSRLYKWEQPICNHCEKRL